LHEFLDLIHDHMLVAQMEGSVGEEASQPGRYSCKAVEAKLQQMLVSSGEPTYLTATARQMGVVGGLIGS